MKVLEDVEEISMDEYNALRYRKGKHSAPRTHPHPQARAQWFVLWMVTTSTGADVKRMIEYPTRRSAEAEAHLHVDGFGPGARGNPRVLFKSAGGQLWPVHAFGHGRPVEVLGATLSQQNGEREVKNGQVARVF